MITRAVILNGPPGSGKDTLADAFASAFSTERRAFKDGLIDLTADLLLVDRDWFRLVCADRDEKETPKEQLGGRSPRQALIYVSEEVHWDTIAVKCATADKLAVAGYIHIEG